MATKSVVLEVKEITLAIELIELGRVCNCWRRRPTCPATG